MPTYHSTKWKDCFGRKGYDHQNRKKIQRAEEMKEMKNKRYSRLIREIAKGDFQC